MGNKGAKAGANTVKKPKDLASKDYKFLTSQTGQSKEQIKAIYEQFMANNPDGQLDKAEFVRLYDELRTEPREILN